jgi:RNA ligase
VTLDEVREILEGNENFIIAERPGYTVVNYVRAGNDTFPPVTDRKTAILRELRGAIFCPETGEFINRRFHKFFNLGEREDMGVLDIRRPHVILEKLDGSMITPLVINMKMRWMTKMGITDVALQAEEFVRTQTEYAYEDAAGAMMILGWTPIFEWCSRKQRIVIDYPQDRLVLLAARNNRTGKYLPRSALETFKQFVPVVDVAEESSATILTFGHIIQRIRNLQDSEGVVIAFDDGHMVKVKAETYVSLHRAKSLLDNERDVTGLVLEDKVDDLYPLLPVHDRERLRNYSNNVLWDVRKFAWHINFILEALREQTSRVSSSPSWVGTSSPRRRSSSNTGTTRARSSLWPSTFSSTSVQPSPSTRPRRFWRSPTGNKEIRNEEPSHLYHARRPPWNRQEHVPEPVRLYELQGPVLGRLHRTALL